LQAFVDDAPKNLSVCFFTMTVTGEWQASPLFRWF